MMIHALIPSHAFSFRLRRLALGSLPLLIVACAGADSESEDVSELASADVVTHVYQKPALPTANYDPPAVNVIYVAPTGNDTSGAGTLAAPYATIAKAVAIANAKAAGPTWTIVLRGGTYREGEFVISRDNVTIQRYKTEPAQILGSVPLTSFTGSGPYTTTVSSFDPTYLEGSCADAGLLGQSTRDYGAETAILVTRAGVPLRRIATGQTPGAGQYTYDPATNKLTIHDSPTSVEFGKKIWAVMTKASNVKLAGLDIEGYANCEVNWSASSSGRTWYKAAVIFYKDSEAASNCVLENSTVANNASSSLAIARADGVKITGNTLVNNGGNAAHAGNASGLEVTNNALSFNNVRRWSNTTEAGMKVTNIQNGVVFGNVIEHNASTGFWCDQRCGSTDPNANWFVLAQNLVRYNDKRGLFFEVSHHGVIASNVVHDNGASGIAAFGSRNVRIWNNTAVDNNASTAGYEANISVVDDSRCAAGDTVPGGEACTTANGLNPLPIGQYDHCEPSSQGALANTCNAEGISIENNIVSGSRGTRPLVNVDDPNASHYGAKRIVVAQDFQAYWRPSTTAPTNVLSWETNAGASAIGYASLGAFKSGAPGYESNAVEKTGGATHPYFVDYADKNFLQNTASADVWGRGAAIPAEVLKAIYWPSTAPAQPSKRIGAIVWADMPTAAPACELGSPVYHRENPTTGDHLFTTSLSEANGASGYTVDHGTAFEASSAAEADLVPVYRLANPTTHAHLWTTSASERASALTKYGYTSDEGIAFYVDAASETCAAGVYRLQHLAFHTFTASTAERNSLVAAGWNDEGIHFYAAAP